MPKASQHLTLTLAILAMSIAGCGEELVDRPTWVGEIEELMISNCGRCHGPTPPDLPDDAPLVPSDLRLDLYESDDTSLRTVSDPLVQDRIRARSVDYEDTPETQMPPDSYLTNHQKELLERWLDDGAPFE